LAQDKIVSLEKENEALRQQNEELVAAAEIIKERADMLASEMNFLKNDRDSLDQSFKNELLILRNQLNRKDSEIQKASSKTEELESRLKFDMKKIRVRERELENRLELLRAEKNALVKSKDEMILDLRRKCDQFQLETESFRQKCIELNKVIESSQESVKRTTRALRLAMANLELQDEGKQLIKKAE
jgi:chromosome segregation ATPase